LSLVELLVAMAILAVATIIALTLYEGARNAFHVGENVSEQQQAVRIAYDLVASDIRHAGFNANPDGSESRPDEAIEAALDRAIVIRADFDNEDPVDARSPEESLAGSGSAFLSVTTGNDEIRAYALAKPDGSSTGTLTFQADVGQSVRDGTVETVTIPNVDLTHGNPPYTLYRITLADDASPQRTVLIENVKSMRFEYYDRASEPIMAAGGLDDETSLAARAEIQRVGVAIEALTRDPDLHSRQYRRFALAADVTPRNVGLMGIKDYQADSVPPAAPAAPQLFPGHCGGFYIGWPPNPPEDEVAYYSVRFGTSPGDLTEQRAVDDTEVYIGGLLDAQQYYVSLQAVDDSGNQSAQGPLSNEITLNSNTPEAPLNLTATVGEDRKVGLEWHEVTANTTGTSGDPNSPLLRELAGYRLYRDVSSGFTPGSSNRVADETEILPAPDPFFEDERIVNCRQYYYRVTAVDKCGLEGGASGEDSGRSTSNVQPKPPANVQAFYHTSADQRRIVWDAVTRDVNDDRVYIEDYEVWRAGPRNAALPPPTPDQFARRPSQPEPGTNIFIDDNVVLGNDEAVWYAVKAKDDCPNFSELSAPDQSLCWFAGTAEFLAPAPDSKVWGNTEITVRVAAGVLEYEELRLYIVNDGTRETIEHTAHGGNQWTFYWNAKPPDSAKGSYTIRAEIDQDNSGRACTRTTEIQVVVDNN
jgi:type II secretory pathway pseudopilin PulG